MITTTYRNPLQINVYWKMRNEDRNGISCLYHIFIFYLLLQKSVLTDNPSRSINKIQIGFRLVHSLDLAYDYCSPEVTSKPIIIVRFGNE